MAALPSYRYRLAPHGLMTRRQLNKVGLSAYSAVVVGEIRWRRGRRVAYLYDPTTARPLRPMTAGRWRSHAAMMRARRTCPGCRTVRPYVISLRHGVCADCMPEDEHAA